MSAADFYLTTTKIIESYEPIEFPIDGPNIGSVINRIKLSTFNLKAIGSYQIQFQIDTTSKLSLMINSVNQPYIITITNNYTIGTTIINTTKNNTIIYIVNSNYIPLTINNAHLTIIKLL